MENINIKGGYFITKAINGENHINAILNKKTFLIDRNKYHNFQAKMKNKKSSIKEVKVKKKETLIYNYHFIKNRIKKTHYYILLSIIFLFSTQIKVINESENTGNYTNEITIKINGTGNQIIIYKYYPNEIYINENKKGENQNYIVLTESETIIRMIWFDKLTSCDFMFYNLKNITEIDLSKFDSSNIKYTNHMFEECNSLKSINFNNFNTSSVTNMGYMFYRCHSLKSLNLSNFDTSNVVQMEYMFFSCINLELLDISNFNTSKVIDMSAIFYDCYLLSTLNLSHFDTSSLNTMYSMFSGCHNLELLDISNFNTSKVINMSQTFYYCYSLTSLNLSHFDTSNVILMYSMFCGCNNLEFLDISNFNTSKVTSMSSLFSDCHSLTSLNLSHFDTSNVKSMFNMFFDCKHLELLDISNYDTSKVIDMGQIFWYCYLLTSLNLSHFDTSNVIWMNSMFCGCFNLELLNISNFNTSKVRTMYQLFSGCYSLTSLNLSHFDTSSVTEMYRMFCDCYFLKLLDISNFNTSKVSSMYYMFYDCNSLTSLNLSHFDTHLVTKMYGMFYYCNNLQYINLKYAKENISLIYTNIFDNVPENIVYCIDENNAPNLNFILKNKTCSTYYCLDNWKEKQKNILIVNNKYICDIQMQINTYVTSITNLISNTSNSETDNYSIEENYFFENKTNETNKKSKINNDSLLCPSFFDNKNLILTNNFTKEIYSELGNIITYKIKQNNIDPFNENIQIFNDICKNFTIENIDIPIKERRQIIFLGYKEKKLICNDIDCNIEEYYLSNFTGICKCKINTNFNYLFSNEYNETNKMTYEEYKIFINEKSKINSFLIFKCFKEAFLFDNLKINPGFYISVIFIFIQLILYILHLFAYLDNKTNIKINPNPPKVQKFEINDDFDDLDDKEKEYNKNKLLEDKQNSDKENEIIFLRIEKNQSEKKKFTNINSTEINNNTNEVLITQKEININKIQKKSNIKKINNTEDKHILEINVNNIISTQKEVQNEKNVKFKSTQNKKKKRSIKNLPPIQYNKTTSNDFIEKTETKTINKDNEIPILKISKSFKDYYWEILSLEQPIINLLEPIKILKIEKSYIPMIIKLNRFIFILSLNIFFNIFHLEQKYLRKKYNYLMINSIF